MKIPVELRISADEVAGLIRRQLARTGAKVSTARVETLQRHLDHFDETWKTAGEALGRHRRCAAQLHSAGLLCRIDWPEICGGKRLSVRRRVVYCVDPTLLR